MNEINTNQLIGKNIAFLRTILGLGPKEFSDLLEVKPNSLWRWESGQAEPQLKNQRNIISIWNSQGIPRVSVLSLSTVDLEEDGRNYTTRNTLEPNQEAELHEEGSAWGFDSFRQSDSVSMRLRLTVDELNYIKQKINPDLLSILSWKGLEEIIYSLRLMRGGLRGENNDTPVEHQ